MTRRACLMWTMLVVAGIQAARGAQDGQTFRGRAEAVAVNVVVRDRGRPVPNLKAADFELLDNGVRQEISSTSSELVPVDATLILDTSGSVQGAAFEQLKRDILQMAAMLKPEDRIRLIAFAGRVVDVVGLQPGTTALPLERLTAGGSTSLENALAAALMVAPGTDRAQLAFALTDGVGTPGLIDPRRLVKLAEYSSATLYVALVSPEAASTDALTNMQSRATIGLGLRTPSAILWQLPYRDALEATVQAAGGRLYDSRGDSLPSLFRAVLDDFRQSYVLRYSPRGVTPGGWHDIVVKVSGRPGLTVRARKGYEGS
jgi:VWFA-related protein